MVVQSKTRFQFLAAKLASARACLVESRRIFFLGCVRIIVFLHVEVEIRFVGEGLGTQLTEINSFGMLGFAVLIQFLDGWVVFFASGTRELRYFPCMFRSVKIEEKFQAESHGTELALETARWALLLAFRFGETHFSPFRV